MGTQTKEFSTCISELQSKLSGDYMISLTWNVGKYRVERKPTPLGNCMGGLEAFAILASEARIGVAFSLVYLLAPANTQAGTFHAPMCHTAMACPILKTFSHSYA